MNDKQHIILAPHPDDECISNHEIMKKYNFSVVYKDVDNNNPRLIEAKSLKYYYQKLKSQYFISRSSDMILPAQYLNNPHYVLYFPDPTSEIHPSHRKYGAIGERLLRDGNNVVFYSTNMNVPYIHEVHGWMEKEEILNKVYPSQKDLWKYEKKYLLFEGRTRWLV